MIKITVPKIRNFLSNVLGSSSYTSNDYLGFSHVTAKIQKKVIADIGFNEFLCSWNVPLEYYDPHNYGRKRVKDGYIWQGLILPYLMFVADNDQIIQASKEIINKADNPHKLFNLFNIFIKSPIIKNYQSGNNICNNITRNIIDRIDPDRLNNIRKSIISLFLENLENSYKQDYAISLDHLSQIPLEYFPENSKNIILSFIFETNEVVALNTQYKCLSHIYQLPDKITVDVKAYLLKVFNKRAMFNEQLKIFELFKEFLTPEELEQYNKKASRKFIRCLGEV